MLKFGYAQEIITPPTGVKLSGYINVRPNAGMYDDLMVKVILLESKGTCFGFVTFDLLKLVRPLFAALKEAIVEKFGQDFHDRLIISATHTHTASEFPITEEELARADDRTRYAFRQTVDAAVRALERARMNLLPGELEVGSVYNNPYGFVRRYWMKNGMIVTNPGWRNPEIDKPESDFDRTISILAFKQNGRTAALICNIANHGDTTGGNLVSADWYGRFAQEIQHALKSGLPVMVVDDASGNINHFDFRQDICQTSPEEAVRIGRGYAAIVLEQLDRLEPVAEAAVEIRNREIRIPHRKISDEEYAEAKHTLATVPDIPKNGDLESQDLANKVPAALRFFAKCVIDCREKSAPFHTARITSIKLGREIAFVSLPGEPFNGIGAAIRRASPCRYTFIIELAQSFSRYVPMRECFQYGGYEVQPRLDSVAPEAAETMIRESIENLI
ncbi:MAG: hypothetical protein E7055_18865 [Lentisphaerae bacterium]|nr:hypothetical protein [Lentisphaerota bacterium]